MDESGDADPSVPTLNEQNQAVSKKKNGLHIFIWVIVGLLFLVLVVLGVNSNKEGKSLKEPFVSVEEAMQDEGGGPVPFQEMTIPYLRDRKYASEMGGLEEVSSNANYTSYKTSYTSDGLTVYGQLTEPTGDMPTGGWPAIIFVHGYIPPVNYQTFSNYGDYVDYLARNGFVVFKIDLRGHGESEGEASGAYYSGDYIVDVLSAREALRSLDFVNREKIGVWGHSMAGNVALRSFVAAKDIPAVVIWAGAVYTYEDMQEYGIDDNSYRPPANTSERQRRRESLFNTHGEFSTDSAFWRTVVPTNYLDGLTGAIQLNHAVNDDVVNIEYSRGLKNILESTEIVSELNEYESGGHNISGSAFNRAMENTVRFFKENL